MKYGPFDEWKLITIIMWYREQGRGRKESALLEDAEFRIILFFMCLLFDIKNTFFVVATHLHRWHTHRPTPTLATMVANAPKLTFGPTHTRP